MRSLKACLAGVLVATILVNSIGTGDTAMKSVAKEIGKDSVLVEDIAVCQDKEESKEEYLSDAQGLVYRFPRDDEGEIERTDAWAVSGGESIPGEIVIPDTFQGKPVIAVDWNGFSHRENLTSVTLGKNISYIDSYAFIGCKKLSEVILNESCKFINSAAFEECISLKRIDFPKSLRSVWDSAFSGSGLEEVIFPEEMEHVWDYSFRNCKNLKKVDLGKKITEIRSNSFEGCSALTEIVIPETVEFIRDESFADCTKLEKVVFEGKVRDIEKDAFRDTPFIKQEKNGKYCIVNGILVETYGEFKGNLVVNGKKPMNGESIRSIGGVAYSNNKKLRKVTIKNLDKIAGNAFEKCKVTECKIQNVNEISYYAFNESKIDIVRVRNIENLDQCMGVMTAKEFYASDIGDMGYEAIPNGVKKVVVDGIRKKCVIPNIRGMQKLKYAKIKGNIKEIDADCIQFSPKLEKLIIETPLIPEWTMTPGDWEWFTRCNKLKHIYIKAKGIDNSIIGVFPKKMTLHVPEYQLEEYKSLVRCNVEVWEK